MIDPRHSLRQLQGWKCGYIGHPSVRSGRGDWPLIWRCHLCLTFDIVNGICFQLDA